MEERKEALVERNAIIDESGLSVVDMEKERCGSLFWFVVLVSVGLCCVAFCILVHGA